MDKLLSTRQVAQKYGVTTREVLYALRRGKIKGQKAGWIWLFDPKLLPKTWPIRRKRKREKVV